VMNDLDDFPTPGRSCAERGGIFDPNTLVVSNTRRAQLDFSKQNGFYTGERKINHTDGANETIRVTDPRARGYRTCREPQYAIDWIQETQSRDPGRSWMLPLGVSALHAPVPLPPAP